MRFQAYALGLFLAILGPAALMVLPGCGSNGNLGGGLPDAATPLGGAGGSTSVPTSTGGTLASGGAVQGGISIAGGAVQGGISITGGAVQGGISINGGAVLGGSSGMGGAVRGGNAIAGGAVQGGSSGTGGSSQTGDAGVGGVTLSASVTSDGSIVPLWQNQSRVSIFLYGCGSANVWKKNGSDWVNRGTAVHCAWEGISPEVPAGSSYSDAGPAYAVALAWGPGIYRLQGNYGVGCTNPELGQSKAGCTAFYEAVSNEVTVVAVPDAGAGGAGGMGGGTGSGGTPTGGAAGAGTGGTNTGGAGGAGTGGTAIGGAGGTAACQQVGTLDQSCLVDSDCLAVRHTTNCCGASVWLGINKAGAQEFSTLESVCDASYPACGCASGPPTTSDGSSIPFGTTAAVTCQGGVCKTYASACGHLCETGRSCITCGQADAGVSVCSLRCPSGTGCTEAAYSQCLSSFNGGVCVAPDLPCTGY